MKVLVIEDDNSTQLLIKKIFGDSLEYTVCSNGVEGIDVFVDQMLEFDHFDAVLLDINIPDLNGVHTLHLIRRFEAVKGIMDNRKAKVIMMTGTADEDNVKNSLKNGCDQFLIKPVTKEKIEAKFKAVGLRLNLSEKTAGEPESPAAEAEPAES
ncbi:MAG: response regulator [Lentisphaeraceae bacterium]|nr:response regulator [Lentisphaeraceae bacterium]